MFSHDHLVTGPRLTPQELEVVLGDARQDAQRHKLPYAGSLTTEEAFALLRADKAVLIDVRTPEERKYVGFVPDSISVPWATGMSMRPNPRFIDELLKRVNRHDVVLFMCQSGPRSKAAAQAATNAQFTNAFYILEGFEGELNEHQQRGTNGGWRSFGLPWIQD